MLKKAIGYTNHGHTLIANSTKSHTLKMLNGKEESVLMLT
jgi:hypothetical protein